MGTSPGIFRAYDIRGIWPEEIDIDTAYKIGQAYVDLMKPEKEVLVGRDVRIHSEELKDALIEGIINAGVDVVDVGLISTDMLYFGAGNYDVGGGIQVTASHNPKEWHGMKLVRAKAVPISSDSGIFDIRDWVMGGKKVASEKKGKVRQMNILDDYCNNILGWVDVKGIKPMRVVINPNFGYAGVVFHRLTELGKLPLEIIDLNSEPDGNFPKGRPDPLIPENRDELIALVKSTGANLGITWDADADRVFFCADGGVFTEPYYVDTLLIRQVLKKSPGEKVVYDVRYSWALVETVKQNGGIPLICKVGHSFIKEMMRLENAVFGAESSGHTYYRDFWFADCGMIPAVQILEYLSDTGKKLSEELEPVMKAHPISGEINYRVTNADEMMEKFSELYKDAQIDRTDGVVIEYPDFRFSLRKSNNEPIFRLCLEAREQKVMEEKRDEVIGHIKEWAVWA